MWFLFVERPSWFEFDKIATSSTPAPTQKHQRQRSFWPSLWNLKSLVIDLPWPWVLQKGNFEEKFNLLNEENVQVLGDRDLSPRNHSQQSRFSFSIGAYQPISPASCDAEMRIFQEHLSLCTNGHIVDLHIAWVLKSNSQWSIKCFILILVMERTPEAMLHAEMRNECKTKSTSITEDIIWYQMSNVSRLTYLCCACYQLWSQWFGMAALQAMY